MRQMKCLGVVVPGGALFSSQTAAENIQVPLREYTSMSQELMDGDRLHEAGHGGLPATPTTNTRPKCRAA